MSIEKDGHFQEFKRTPFDAEHQEKLLEDWIENNPDSLLDNMKLLPIGRQVLTNLGSYIDLLCLDREGNAVVIELKRGRTPRDTLAQALEYASFIADLDADQIEGILKTYTNDEATSLTEYHRATFNLDPEEAVAFNKKQLIIIVGQNVTSEIRQTSSYLRARGIDVKCVEFSFFQSDDGRSLFSQDTVIGDEPLSSQRITSGTRSYLNENSFLQSIDDFGKPVYKNIIDYTQTKETLKLEWHISSFSVSVIIGDYWLRIYYCYIPETKFGQSIATYFWGQAALNHYTNIPEDVLQSIQSEMLESGLFTPAGMNLKCMIDRKMSESEIDKLIYFIDKIEKTVLKYGLNDDESGD